MSLLFKLTPKRVLSHLQVLNSLSFRRQHWAPDYKPSQCPKTKEEILAAAKKYNLFPEEYEPYPEDTCVGDYPKLPEVSAQAKDPYYDYDMPELRRNFNEPIHFHYYLTLGEYYNTEPPSVPNKTVFFYFVAIITTIAIVFYSLQLILINESFTEKQFPKPGVKHYTFELDYDALARRQKECECPPETDSDAAA